METFQPSHSFKMPSHSLLLRCLKLFHRCPKQSKDLTMTTRSYIVWLHSQALICPAFPWLTRPQPARPPLGSVNDPDVLLGPCSARGADLSSPAALSAPSAPGASAIFPGGPSRTPCLSCDVPSLLCFSPQHLFSSNYSTSFICWVSYCPPLARRQGFVLFGYCFIRLGESLAHSRCSAHSCGMCGCSVG